MMRQYTGVKLPDCHRGWSAVGARDRCTGRGEREELGRARVAAATQSEGEMARGEAASDGRMQMLSLRGLPAWEERGRCQATAAETRVKATVGVMLGWERDWLTRPSRSVSDSRQLPRAPQRRPTMKRQYTRV